MSEKSRTSKGIPGGNTGSSNTSRGINAKETPEERKRALARSLWALEYDLMEAQNFGGLQWKAIEHTSHTTGKKMLVLSLYHPDIDLSMSTGNGFTFLVDGEPATVAARKKVK